MLKSRIAAIALLAAILLVAPLHAVFAQTVPDLATANSFTILGGPAVTLTNSAVVGNIGVAPGGAITQTTSTVDGIVHLGDLAAEQAHDDFLTAYGNVVATGNVFACNDYPFDAAYTAIELILPPGVYCTGTALTFTGTTIKLDAKGDPNAVWIFKVGTSGVGALTGTGLSVVMANSGQPGNVYWWAADAVTMTTSTLKGNVLAGGEIVITNGSLIGRTLSKLAVTMTGPDVVGITP